MNNTLENKGKFFAQYWGQDVVTLDGINEIPVYKMFNPIRTEETQSRSYLELTPLSQISDEDYRNLVQSEVMNPEHPSDEIDISNGHLSSINLSDVATVDFLRSRGYALPWMGLSVGQLVEYGWVKLKVVDNEQTV